MILDKLSHDPEIVSFPKIKHKLEKPAWRQAIKQAVVEVEKEEVEVKVRKKVRSSGKGVERKMRR